MSMATGVNKKRKHHKEPEGRSLWGYLFRPRRMGEEMSARSFFFSHAEEEEEEDNEENELSTLSLLLRLRRRFSVWMLVSFTLFITFTAALLLTLVKMWIPQDLSDIRGYGDHAAARDLAAMIRNANGGAVTITEAEINRFLRDTCRMRQTGIFSIITHGQGVAVRIHNGYAELIFDRIMGANMHQTTAVNLSFTRENHLGTPELHMDFQGGEPILGGMPNGGRIGLIAMPQRHILMLKPAIESLFSCYPEIAELIREYHYLPVFSAGSSSDNRCMTLVPYTSSN